MTPQTTFIYCLNDPRDGRLRYVGKADNPFKRWGEHISNSGSSNHRGAWIRSLLSVGLKPELEVLEEIPHEGWQEIEREYIRVFRMINMNLTNGTEGGDGLSNPSLETRAKISAARKGKLASPETRAKISVTSKNPSPKTRAKMRANRLGKKASAETRAKLSAGRIGNKNSLGYKASPETRAKLRASQKARRAREKAIRCLEVPPKRADEDRP